VIGVALSLLALLTWALHRLAFGVAPQRRRGRTEATVAGLQHEGGR
jgi:hypothetical protein